jgi:molecular chaperone IbpA
MYTATNTAIFANLDKYFIGSDRLTREMLALAHNKPANYPPYNIKQIADYQYIIEMAVAGFKDTDIDITHEDNKLRIKGKMETLDDLTLDGETQTYLYKGISDRAFTREYTLADNIEIKSADLADGMLKILLEHKVPEEKKPKKILINQELGEKKTKR